MNTKGKESGHGILVFQGILHEFMGGILDILSGPGTGTGLIISLRTGLKSLAQAAAWAAEGVLPGVR